MDRLWAPWRKAYLEGAQTKGCWICRIRRSKRDRVHFVLRRSAHGFAILNLYPYNNGHTMLIPNRHVKRLSDLSDVELLDLLQLTNWAIERIEKRMRPHGMNLGINFGRVSGAGVPDHVHIHVVPRWKGDTNFMPVIGHAKVISESLESVYRKLAVPNRAGKSSAKR